MSEETASPELAQELRRSVLRLARRIRAQRVDTSLTLSQLSALGTLDVHGPLSAGQVANREQVQPPTMTKVLAALVDRGLITRAPNPDDRRSALLAVTPAGHATVEAERQARDVWLTERLHGLAADELEQLRRLLPLLDRIGPADPPSVDPSPNHADTRVLNSLP